MPISSTPKTPPRQRTKNPETPRRRKDPPSTRLRGVKTTLPPELDVAQIKLRLIRQFGLPYVPDDWQAHTIRRILQGFDVFICAGTGYGKTLIFEGLAVLGDKGKLVLVVCPLKALEYDQAKQAQAKGIEAVVINEDTESTVELWNQLKTSAQLTYLSPEMARSDRFSRLWKEVGFRTRITALVVDEAHCIDDYGDDDFRPDYRLLDYLRAFTGQEVPFVACTATPQTKTFNLIWKTLGYGHRPFWGIDVGVDRPNLSYITRILENPKMPVVDILNLFPPTLDNNTATDAIAKMIIYQDSERACRELAQAVRKCLPAHLREQVHAFSSNLSEEAKKIAWTKFSDGAYRILCATDAAGMGCNVIDIQYVVILGCPKSLSAVAQRWGRAGRNRTVDGVCLLLVPEWTVRPPVSNSQNPAVQRVKGTKKAGASEGKNAIMRRSKLDPRLEQFINIKSDNPAGCCHRFMRETFRPETGLDTRMSLTGEGIHSRGPLPSAYEMTWTIADLQRVPPREQCCHLCCTELLARYSAASKDDRRLFAFGKDFKFPLAVPPSRPNSRASTSSILSDASDDFRPVSGKRDVDKEDKARLTTLLVDWREKQYTDPGYSGDRFLLSSEVILPDALIKKLTEGSIAFLKAPLVTPREITKVAKWDLASAQDLQAAATIIGEWRLKAKHYATPTSNRGRRKKARTTSDFDVEMLPSSQSIKDETGDDDVFLSSQGTHLFSPISVPSRSQQVTRSVLSSPTKQGRSTPLRDVQLNTVIPQSSNPYQITTNPGFFRMQSSPSVHQQQTPYSHRPSTPLYQSHFNHLSTNSPQVQFMSQSSRPPAAFPPVHSSQSQSQQLWNASYQHPYHSPNPPPSTPLSFRYYTPMSQ